MRKIGIFLFLCALFLCRFAHAGQMVNVEYIHLLIEQKWGITVPYNPALQNVKVAANMKYLLTAVDRANKILNGDAITDYGNGEYATLYAADTVAAIDATDRLVKIEPKFWITTTGDTSRFEFTMSARGTFMVDWGDGTKKRIVRADTESVTYSHEYSVAGEYKIGFGGLVTGYNEDTQSATIRFSGNKNTAKIEGSLGRVFSTIDNGDGTVSQPRFYETFYGNSNLKGSIPGTLFDGIYGQPIQHMFRLTFQNCSGLSGSIPENLFAGLEGTPKAGMFWSTFNNCSGLTGSIPENLFAKIEGVPQYYSFLWTFSGCAGLTGKIPGKLFAGMKGAPAMGMFNGTFSGCTGLSGSIPADLFVGIKGRPANNMFNAVFNNCAGLTGSIPENLFAGVVGAPANGMFSYAFAGCAGLTGEIPEKLFNGIQGVPAANMFASTFSDCSGLTGQIPEKLFAGITSGPAAEGMFAATFRLCWGLTGASARINGVPLYQIWPDATYDDVAACYLSMYQLTDWADIPIEWKLYQPEE